MSGETVVLDARVEVKRTPESISVKVRSHVVDAGRGPVSLDEGNEQLRNIVSGAVNHPHRIEHNDSRARHHTHPSLRKNMPYFIPSAFSFSFTAGE